MAHLLVVDDEPAIATLWCQLLRVDGHQAQSFTRAADAIRFVETDGGTVDAVILDMLMPEIDGAEAFKRMRALRKDLPVLVTTGYMFEEASEMLAKQTRVEYLSKPFRSEEALAAVSRTLAL